MKRNKDRDIIHFSGSDKTCGPRCEYYDNINISIPVNVGSDFCKHCPLCYGEKIRWWTNEETGSLEYDGYVKCALKNKSLLNRIKAWWWHNIKREKADIKYFN